MRPTADLPPRPDPSTGLPAPPPAPGPRRRPPARRTPTRPEPPPEGRGHPILAGRSGEPRDGAIVLGVGLLGLVVLLDVTAGLDRLASAPAGTWVFVALAVLLLVAWARGVSTAYLAVGADWLASHRTWVDLYDLVEVRCTHAAYGLPLLELRDGSGRRVRRYVSELRADPLVWDLVHLGVRWSRATQEVRVDRAAEAVVGDDPLPAGALAQRSRVTVVRVRRDVPQTADLPPRPDPWTCRPVPRPRPGPTRTPPCGCRGGRSRSLRAGDRWSGAGRASTSGAWRPS